MTLASDIIALESVFVRPELGIARPESTSEDALEAIDDPIVRAVAMWCLEKTGGPILLIPAREGGLEAVRVDLSKEPDEA